MAKTDSTKKLWRVQVRIGRGRAWKNKGLYETRADARYVATILRNFPDMSSISPIFEGMGYGFGNTRILRHIRGEKK